jgi:2-keto-3-deoxy-6-phosphogluconate aldolase
VGFFIAFADTSIKERESVGGNFQITPNLPESVIERALNEVDN